MLSQNKLATTGSPGLSGTGFSQCTSEIHLSESTWYSGANRDVSADAVDTTPSDHSASSSELSAFGRSRAAAAAAAGAAAPAPS
eukprot:8933140-Pyramimonas_sp.AAC.1